LPFKSDVWFGAFGSILNILMVRTSLPAKRGGGGGVVLGNYLKKLLLEDGAI